MFGSYSEDKMHQVRLDCRFENFTAMHDSQAQAKAFLFELANQVVDAAPVLAADPHAFRRATLLFLHGKPGRGKTHLVEAFINEVLERAPGLRSLMVLSRGRFMYDYQTTDSPYGDSSIVIIDDMYHDKMDVRELHPATDVRSFMKFITDLYDNHRLVIVTSNFPLLNGGIMGLVQKTDTIGRIVSRAAEVMAGAGELELLGDDYRQRIASESRRQRITPRLPFPTQK